MSQRNNIYFKLVLILIDPELPQLMPDFIPDQLCILQAISPASQQSENVV
jgi:hypothetical protein